MLSLDQYGDSYYQHPDQNIGYVHHSQNFLCAPIGVQKETPQDVPQHYLDCFKLGDLDPGGSREASVPHLTIRRNLDREPDPELTDY